MTKIFERTTEILRELMVIHLSVNVEVIGIRRKERHCQTGKKVVERHDRNLEVEIQFFDFFSLFQCLNAQVTKSVTKRAKSAKTVTLPLLGCTTLFSMLAVLI